MKTALRICRKIQVKDEKVSIKESYFLKEKNQDRLGAIIQYTSEYAFEMNTGFLSLLIKIVYHVLHKSQ